MNSKKPSKWSFTPSQDILQETAGATVTALVYSTGMLIVMNPVIFAISATVSALGASAFLHSKTAKRVIYDSIKNDSTPGFRNASRGFVHMDPAKQAKIEAIKQDIEKKAKDLELAETPELIIMSDEMAKDMARKKIPLWRKVFFPKQTKERIDLAPTMTAAAISTSNVVLVAEGFIGNKMSAEEVSVIMSHELSHIKAKDSGRLSQFVDVTSSINNRISKVALIGLGIASLFTAIPTLPIVAAYLAVPIISRVSKFGTKFASRVAERRADRNAVFIEGSEKGGVSLFNRLSKKPNGKTQKKPYPMTLYDTHPQTFKRVKNLKKNFKRVAAFSRKTSGAEPQARQVNPKLALS